MKQIETGVEIHEWIHRKLIKNRSNNCFNKAKMLNIRRYQFLKRLSLSAVDAQVQVESHSNTTTLSDGR